MILADILKHPWFTHLRGINPSIPLPSTALQRFTHLRGIHQYIFASLSRWRRSPPPTWDRPRRPGGQTIPEQVPPPPWDQPNDALPAIANCRVSPLGWDPPQRSALHPSFHLISHRRGIRQGWRASGPSLTGFPTSVGSTSHRLSLTSQDSALPTHVGSTSGIKHTRSTICGFAHLRGTHRLRLRTRRGPAPSPHRSGMHHDR